MSLNVVQQYFKHLSFKQYNRASLTRFPENETPNLVLHEKDDFSPELWGSSYPDKQDQSGYFPVETLTRGLVIRNLSGKLDLCVYG